LFEDQDNRWKPKQHLQNLQTNTDFNEDFTEKNYEEDKKKKDNTFDEKSEFKD